MFVRKERMDLVTLACEDIRKERMDLVTLACEDVRV